MALLLFIFIKQVSIKGFGSVGPGLLLPNEMYSVVLRSLSVGKKNPLIYEFCHDLDIIIFTF